MYQLIGYHNVFGFQIAMQDPKGVDIQDPDEHLLGYIHDLWLLQIFEVLYKIE